MTYLFIYERPHWPPLAPGPRKLHVFLATPHGAALLLGHLWDRMPLTQLYEDHGASKGYVPSFLIPN